MTGLEKYQEKELNHQSKMLLEQLLSENKKLKEILSNSTSANEVNIKIRVWVLTLYTENSNAYLFFKGELHGREAFEKLSWSEVAAARILEYIDNRGNEYEDPNLTNEIVLNRPFELVWRAYKFGTGETNEHFFLDMIYLFRQFMNETSAFIPTRNQMEQWMNSHPSGLDDEIIQIRNNNKDRIIKCLLEKIDKGILRSSHYFFENGLSHKSKIKKMQEWWEDRNFHLKFAVREPVLLNELMDYSLDETTVNNLNLARQAGIPLFVNPYYLSLLNTKKYKGLNNADQAIRDYIFHSKALIDEFGKIKAWEKEDIIKDGEPNAAGWLLPNEINVHRRYPEVAILIPETVGRACAGLCVSCQRMYDFQRGHLNFNLEKLRPKPEWKLTLSELLKYFETDTQLRDILITGGDAFMSTDNSLRIILDEVYEMAVRKKQANTKLPDGEKYAEIIRVRLGTRMLAYLPQRITPELISILKAFKKKAVKIGIRQFVIQTHFETAMELTPESKKAIECINEVGWIVTNQTVFTAASSRRGHTSKLRKVLNDIGVLPYYTFSVKGYKENSYNFATNARAVQEQWEEKIFGTISPEYFETIKHMPEHAEKIVDNIDSIRKSANIPFLATDRNVLNLPGVGKSLTFKVIGITSLGRRILEFNHDLNRNHSPVIEKMGKVIIVESKSIKEYLDQLQIMGEDIQDYESIWGYSLGQTEERMSLYEYPDYNYKVSPVITNLKID